MTTTAAALLIAARHSIKIAPVDGVRPCDPLLVLITDSTALEVRPAVEVALGRALDLTGKVPAPYMRAALRRHVAHGVLK